MHVENLFRRQRRSTFLRSRLQPEVVLKPVLGLNRLCFSARPAFLVSKRGPTRSTALRTAAPISACGVAGDGFLLAGAAETGQIGTR